MQRGNLKTETGRSMVEMLGVLAVIGVLSVGGVYAYSTAVKKHKANELMEGASARAIKISTQMKTNQELSIENLGFSNQTGYGTFSSVERNPANSNQFLLKITEVESEVCELMKMMFDENGIVRDLECQTTPGSDFVAVVVKYNAGLSRMSYSSDYNGDESGCLSAENRKYCQGSQECISASQNCECKSAVGVCQICNTDTGRIESMSNGTGCTVDGESGKCQSGNCISLCSTVNCGSHGTCSNGSCVCKDNYYGTNCENAPLVCQNGGTWNTSTHVCDCVTNYAGSVCEKNLCAGYDTQCCTNGDITSTASCTTTDTKEGTCNAGVCEETPTCSSTVGDPCTDNATVCPGYYCSIAAGTTTKDTWCGDDTYTPGAGTIQSLGTPRTPKTGYLSSPSRVASWDAAVNYCKTLKSTIAQGVTVNGVNYGDYGSLSNGLASLACPLVGNYCSALPSDGPYWLDELLQNNCDDWTDYSTTYGSNSCYAFFVTPFARIGTTRRSADLSALCE